MKRLLSLLTALVLCVALTACKGNTTDQNPDATQTSHSECSEQDVRMLIEHNLDCYYLFCVAPLTQGGGTDSDGYTKASTAFFSSYKELSDFVQSTYSKEKSDYLLNSYPTENNPLYIEKNSDIYVDLDAVTPVEYDITWDEGYTIEFTSSSDTQCSFVATTTNFDGDEYSTEGTVVFENGKWLLTDFVC